MRFNLNGGDHTFHLFGRENIFDSAGLLSPEREKCLCDSMRFVSSLKVGTLCQLESASNVEREEARRSNGRENRESLEKINCTTKLQIICQLKLIHSYKIVYRRRGEIIVLDNALSHVTTISI